MADDRVRLVGGTRPGPTTKAECLNRVWQAMCADEIRDGRRFKAIVLHDAEDVIHPDEPALYDRMIERFDLVQIPVLPLLATESRWARTISSTYGDEFAEAHGKSLVLREALGASVPSAGVGCAIARDMMDKIAASTGGLPFAEDCLTEDYELGLRLRELGGRGAFVVVPAGAGRMPVAVRAHIPETMDTAIRQKTRWITGIAFAGWDRLRWRGGLAERWMRLRDRRALIAAVVLAAAYADPAVLAGRDPDRLAGGDAVVDDRHDRAPGLAIGDAGAAGGAHLWRAPGTPVRAACVHRQHHRDARRLESADPLCAWPGSGVGQDAASLSRKRAMRLKGRQARFLVTVLGGWVVLRTVVLWPAGELPARIAEASARLDAVPVAHRMMTPRHEPASDPSTSRVRARFEDPSPARQPGPSPVRHPGLDPGSTVDPGVPAETERSHIAGPRIRSGVTDEREEGAPPTPSSLFPSMPARTRIEAQAYLFLRPGSGRALASGSALGGSQAAARIAVPIDEAGRFAAAGRIYAPLNGNGAEAALGLDWRPLPAVPLRVSVERRQRVDAAGRSAWSAYTAGGFYRELPGKLQLDGYAQAGMVGMQRRDLFASFADRADPGGSRCRNMGGGATGGGTCRCRPARLGPPADTGSCADARHGRAVPCGGPIPPRIGRRPDPRCRSLRMRCACLYCGRALKRSSSPTA